ncbi:MAG: NTP transferase domain-containing protein [Sphingomonadaceae bacterium]|nr:NTP transferase domain-containing protein [Sphingomonadaceae bacterium]
MSDSLDTAILLAAGQGSRLREVCPSKPLCPVAGKPLIDHALDGLASARIARVIVVTGYRAEKIEAHVAGRAETVRTPDWRRPNGVSALAAAALANSALLAMCDHLVDPALYRRMAEAGPGPGLRLGIDRRLGHAWVDPGDVTCVRTEAARIVAIGKGLEPHDAYDTGVFAVGPRFFEALDALTDPSITDAVRRLAGEKRAEAVDCSDLDWIDVDDAPALRKAEDWLAASPGGFFTGLRKRF